MTILLIAPILVLILLTGYFAIKSVEFRKFLTGAFFVSGGVQIYLAFAKVSIPVLGTNIVQDSNLGYTRGVLHMILCSVCFYFGFIKNSKNS